jgi:hypothetical protein
LVRESGSIDFYHSPALRGWAQLRLGRLLTRVRAGLQRPSLNAALARGAERAYVAPRSRGLHHRQYDGFRRDPLLNRAARQDSVIVD